MPKQAPSFWALQACCVQDPCGATVLMQVHVSSELGWGWWCICETHLAPAWQRSLMPGRASHRALRRAGSLCVHLGGCMPACQSLVCRQAASTEALAVPGGQRSCTSRMPAWSAVYCSFLGALWC